MVWNVHTTPTHIHRGRAVLGSGLLFHVPSWGPEWMLATKRQLWGPETCFGVSLDFETWTCASFPSPSHSSSPLRFSETISVLPHVSQNYSSDSLHHGCKCFPSCEDPPNSGEAGVTKDKQDKVTKRVQRVRTSQVQQWDPGFSENSVLVLKRTQVNRWEIRLPKVH
jgi:hypothetical protein